MYQVLMIVFFSLSILPAKTQKIVNVQIAPAGNIMIDRVGIELEDLPKELHQRLWRSYMSTGKMPKSINLAFEEGINEERKKDIITAAKQGQERTLNVLSLHKHKKKFENISSKKKEKIKKQFPVLFQPL